MNTLGFFHIFDFSQPMNTLGFFHIFDFSQPMSTLDFFHVFEFLTSSRERISEATFDASSDFLE